MNIRYSECIPTSQWSSSICQRVERMNVLETAVRRHDAAPVRIPKGSALRAPPIAFKSLAVKRGDSQRRSRLQQCLDLLSTELSSPLN